MGKVPKGLPRAAGKSNGRDKGEDSAESKRKEVVNLHRLLRILTLVRARHEWTPQRLADEFGVAARTIHRDVDKLRSVGFPVVFDRAEGAYRIEGECFLPPMQLSFEEALALTVLCEDVAGMKQISMLQPAYRALSKIEAQLPPDIRDKLERVMDHVAIRTGPAEPEGTASDVHQLIRQAMGSRTALRCVYGSARRTGLEQPFLFEPYSLFFSVRAWYVVGRNVAKGQVRTLKLSRFISAEPTRRPYRIPESFTLGEHIGNAWRMIRGTPEHDVELVFDADFAENVAETRWHPTQSTQRNADGTLTFRCRVAGLDEIVWWILSMGPHCRVVGPKVLAERIRELALGVASLYGPAAEEEPAPEPAMPEADDGGAKPKRRRTARG